MRKRNVQTEEKMEYAEAEQKNKTKQNKKVS